MGDQSAGRKTLNVGPGVVVAHCRTVLAAVGRAGAEARLLLRPSLAVALSVPRPLAARVLVTVPVLVGMCGQCVCFAVGTYAARKRMLQDECCRFNAAGLSRSEE